MLFDWLLEGVILGIIGILGIVGNSAGIYVFYNKSAGVAGIQVSKLHICKKMFKGKVFYRLMLSLACCDLLYVATSLAIFSAPQLWPQYTGYIYDKLPNIMSKARGLSVLVYTF